MADVETRYAINDCTGGRNGADPPWAIAPNECAEAVNVDWYHATVARKRNGADTASTTFSSGGPFTGTISSLFRHVPGTDDTAAELWAVDDDLVVGRMAGAATFAAPTLKDALTGDGWDVSAASCNGMLFLAYKSAQSRLHVWDGSTVRRAGLPAPTAPSAADHGTGTAQAIKRFYRLRWLIKSGSVVTRRSEPSPSVSFTPSGTGLGTRITRPTAPGEGETHWELELSLDGTIFGVFPGATNPIAIATTTTDDDIADPATTYALITTFSPATGTYSLQKSYRFLAADQNRLLGFGSHTSTDKQNRIEISAVLGSLDIGDAERVDSAQVNSYIDLDENDSGVPMGLVGPIFGTFLAFKDRQVWQLTATGTTTQPYRTIALTKSVGLVAPRAWAIGEDADGNPALYFMSHRGPYQYGIQGLRYIGRNVEDCLLPDGVLSTMNLAAANVVSHAVYHADKRQVWFWVATGTEDDPDIMLKYDVVSGGWSRVPSGDKIAAARCSVMFSNTRGATMSSDLKPYLGQTGAVNTLWKGDTGTDDAGTNFKAYVTTRAVEPGGPGFFGAVGDSLVLAKAGDSVTLTATVTRDFGVESRTATALLTPEGSETRVQRRLEDSGYSGAQFIQHTIGDASAVSNGWAVDRIVVPYSQQDAVSA